MPEVVKETIVTQNGVDTHRSQRLLTTQLTGFQRVVYLIYFLGSVLETLLAFRLVLKLMGANPASGFVNFVYGSTAGFILPFEGMFPRASALGATVISIFEPATLIAIPVYAALTWGLVELMGIFDGSPPNT